MTRPFLAAAGLVATLSLSPLARADAPAPLPAPESPPATPPVSSAIPPFVRLALQTEGAVGVSGPFYNHLLGARVDRCFTWNTCLGGYVGYANLKGQEGRANEVLAYALAEHRRPLGKTWFIPLRAAAGYLPRNGPYARVSAGVGAQSGNLDFTFELLAPTLWTTRDAPVLSMDFAAEVAIHL